jgi:hypothetical protein
MVTTDEVATRTGMSLQGCHVINFVAATWQFHVALLT